MVLIAAHPPEAGIEAGPAAAAVAERLQRTPQPPKQTVAYLTSRFPKLTETFVLYEILALEQQGARVELYALQRERTSVMHPEAIALTERAHFAPLVSPKILASHWYFLRRRPSAYVATLWTLIRANWGSLRYLTAALAFFPKAAHFARQMQQENVSHLHAHFASHPAAMAFVIHRLTGIPFSFTAHGSDLHRDRHMLREKVAAAEFAVTISDYNKKVIAEKCGQHLSSKVEVIHCGVDTEFFAPVAERPQSKSPQSTFTVLCIGTLHEVKGQTYLLQACRLLQEYGIALRCELIGEGEDRQSLEAEARRLDLADIVEFCGNLPREEVRLRLQQADVVCAPSVPTKAGRREGIPVVLMEAMASGVPVVASRLSGIPELVEHELTGLLFDPGNARELAAALRRLHDDPKLHAQLASAARQKIEREFNLHRNAARLRARFQGSSV